MSIRPNKMVLSEHHHRDIELDTDNHAVQLTLEQIADLPFEASDSEVIDIVLNPFGDEKDAETLRGEELARVAKLKAAIKDLEVHKTSGSDRFHPDYYPGYYSDERQKRESRVAAARQDIRASPLSAFADYGLVYAQSPADLDAWHRFALLESIDDYEIHVGSDYENLANAVVRCAVNDDEISQYASFWAGIKTRTYQAPEAVAATAASLRPARLAKNLNPKNFYMRKRGGEFDRENLSDSQYFISKVLEYMPRYNEPGMTADDTVGYMADPTITPSRASYFRGVNQYLHDVAERESIEQSPRRRDTSEFMNNATNMLVATLNFYNDPNANALLKYLNDSNATNVSYGHQQYDRKSVVKLSNMITSLQNRQTPPHLAKELIRDGEDSNLVEVFRRITDFTLDHITSSATDGRDYSAMKSDICDSIVQLVAIGTRQIVTDSNRKSAEKTIEESHPVTRDPRKKYRHDRKAVSPGYGKIS